MQYIHSKYETIHTVSQLLSVTLIIISINKQNKIIISGKSRQKAKVYKGGIWLHCSSSHQSFTCTAD